MRSIGKKTWLAALAMLTAMGTVGTPAMAQDQAAPDDKPLSPVPVKERLVFAHYMTAYGRSVEAYKQEIELAQRHGIDGFALNCGEWLGSRYIKSAENMYQAAEELGTGFKIFFSPDAAGLGGLGRNMADMVTRFQDHPNQLRHNGKVVISCWAGNPSKYESAIAEVEKAAGEDVIFVPYFFGNEYNWAMAWSPERVLDFIDRDYVEGLYNFGIDGSIKNVMSQNATGRRMTQYRGKIFMAGAGPTYNSANMRDMQGMKGYGEIWEGIIRDEADWVELVTWNDYNEDSNLNPFRWSYPPKIEKDYYVRDESYLDVTNYYSQWFKTGVQPKITQDKVYFTYRNRSKNQTRVWDEDKQEWRDLRSGNWPVDQIHDDARDRVYVSTFLTEPAQVVVSLGGQEHSFDQPAGIAHAWVPLAAGLPEFTLKRDGKTLASAAGRSEIIDEPTKLNSRHGYHLANRTWTGALAVGDGPQLNVGADFAKAGDAWSTDLPKGLETATYNIRVTYTNAGDDRARLTMISDGASVSEDGDYYIPVFFPPTDGQERTVSFFWSLHGNGSYLSLERQAIDSNHKRAQGMGVDDYGQVSVKSIELVKVDPVRAPEVQETVVPELVMIPGGSFEMGSTEGEPDERPVRHVEVEPFAIGKYEVTNKQFEAFDPVHRKMRDGYSWRDDEPVIYVSWKNAAQYCNWLSEQAGLEPAYEQREFVVQASETWKRKWKEWVLKPDADGFRLPTEAQWEYVASGRGEGRKYPWGNEAPVPMKQGNFDGEQALEAVRVLRAQPSTGVTVVGSFPEGASRDGVMDMAGNVSEWTNDLYIPTGGEGGALWEPESGTLFNERYRALRGGSWGYYNHSQRVADREHNTASYRGYIYLGLRVALPKAGYDKLQAGR